MSVNVRKQPKALELSLVIRYYSVTNVPKNFLNTWTSSNMKKKIRTETEKKYDITPLPLFTLGR